MTNVAYETVFPGRHQIGMVGAIRLEWCADKSWNTRAGSSEYAMSASERERACLVRQAVRGELSQREGAERLAIGVRQFKRLAERGRYGAGFAPARPGVASSHERGDARSDRRPSAR
jgi:hypothetical protein